MNAERPIEKLLRRFAKQRRDEASAPVELHPANRRLLQAEVARRFTKPATRPGWWSDLGVLLNRKLAYAVALGAVVLGGAVLLRPTGPSKVGTLAFKNEPSAMAESEVAKTSAVTANEVQFLKAATSEPAPARNRAASAPAAAPANSASQPTASSDAPPPSLAVTAKAVAPAALSPTPNAEGETEAVMDRAAVRRKQVADSVARYNERSTREQQLASAPSSSGAPSDGSSPATNSIAAKTTTRTSGAAKPAAAVAKAKPGTEPIAKAAPSPRSQNDLSRAVQNFSQTLSAAEAKLGRKPTGASPVLVNFFVEQDGERLRVTDSDGSTYSGVVQLAAEPQLNRRELLANGGTRARATAANSKALNSDARLAGTPSFQNAPNLFFRVSGTNRTLNQQVSFFGNFVTFSNQAQNSGNLEQQSNKTKEALNQWDFAPLLQNSMIQGRLRVGSGSEQELNALPAQK